MFKFISDKHIKTKGDNSSVYLITKQFIWVLVTTLILASCTDKGNKETLATVAAADSSNKPKPSYLGQCRKLFAEARKMDSILLQQNDIDKPSADKAIVAFTDFAYYCQSDSMSPVYLIKSAQVARAIENIPQAKKVLDHCIENYPSFKDRPAALFLLAQLYDEHNYLNDENEARKLYQQILDDYPKSPWAASAKGAIDFIGKSDDEIMQEITKKKKRK
jgi:outer membrane protein assembly factor BamD (BamD/ComL family)